MSPNISDVPHSIMVIDETEYNKKYSNHDHRTNFYEQQFRKIKDFSTMRQCREFNMMGGINSMRSIEESGCEKFEVAGSCGWDIQSENFTENINGCNPRGNDLGNIENSNQNSQIENKNHSNAYMAQSSNMYQNNQSSMRPPDNIIGQQSNLGNQLDKSGGNSAGQGTSQTNNGVMVIQNKDLPAIRTKRKYQFRSKLNQEQSPHIQLKHQSSHSINQQTQSNIQPKTVGGFAVPQPVTIQNTTTSSHIGQTSNGSNSSQLQNGVQTRQSKLFLKQTTKTMSTSIQHTPEQVKTTQQQPTNVQISVEKIQNQTTLNEKSPIQNSLPSDQPHKQLKLHGNSKQAQMLKQQVKMIRELKEQGAPIPPHLLIGPNGTYLDPELSFQNVSSVTGLRKRTWTRHNNQSLHNQQIQSLNNKIRPRHEKAARHKHTIGLIIDKASILKSEKASENSEDDQNQNSDPDNSDSNNLLRHSDEEPSLKIKNNYSRQESPIEKHSNQKRQRNSENEKFIFSPKNTGQVSPSHGLKAHGLQDSVSKKLSIEQEIIGRNREQYGHGSQQKQIQQMRTGLGKGLGKGKQLDRVRSEIFDSNQDDYADGEVDGSLQSQNRRISDLKLDNKNDEGLMEEEDFVTGGHQSEDLNEKNAAMAGSEQDNYHNYQLGKNRLNQDEQQISQKFDSKDDERSPNKENIKDISELNSSAKKLQKITDIEARMQKNISSPTIGRGKRGSKEKYDSNLSRRSFQSPISLISPEGQPVTRSKLIGRPPKVKKIQEDAEMRQEFYEKGESTKLGLTSAKNSSGMDSPSHDESPNKRNIEDVEDEEIEEKKSKRNNKQLVYPQKSGHGKEALQMDWAKILVKISQQKCWLFNIYESNLADAFEVIRIPPEVSSIKNGAQILLTSHPDHNMFVLGGEDKGKYLGQNYSYNFVTLNFKPCMPMSEPKVHFGAIYFRDSVFVVGGWKQFFTKKCQVFRLNSSYGGSGKWLEIAPLLTEREGISLCIVHDRYIYAFGSTNTRGKRFRQLTGTNTNNQGQQQQEVLADNQITTRGTSNQQQGHVSSSTEKYMEYNFDRLDTLALFSYLEKRSNSSLINMDLTSEEILANPELGWETLTLTSTFNIARMTSDKVPSFKNMGCFNHYKHRNQIVIFGGTLHGTNSIQKSFVIDLEKQVIQRGSDANFQHGNLAKADKFCNHLYLKKEGFLYCFGDLFLHRFNLQNNRWDQESVFHISNST